MRRIFLAALLAFVPAAVSTAVTYAQSKPPAANDGSTRGHNCEHERRPITS